MNGLSQEDVIAAETHPILSGEHALFSFGSGIDGTIKAIRAKGKTLRPLWTPCSTMVELHLPRGHQHRLSGPPRSAPHAHGQPLHRPRPLPMPDGRPKPRPGPIIGP